MSQIKKLLFEDEKSGKIVEYNCTRRRDVTDLEVDYFFSSLYGMKLNSSLVNTDALRSGNETKDLIREFRTILDDESTKVIDFNGVIALFNLKSVDQSVVKAPIKKFLGMYNLEKEAEYEKEDVISLIESENSDKDNKNKKHLRETRSAISSIAGNTRALRNVNLENYQKRK